MRQRLVVAGRKGNLAATSCAWIVEAGSDNLQSLRAVSEL
jgi:hypothetical protein